MIFASQNERGELAADLVMARRKTVTRRSKPVAVGKVLAVQPGRGKKGIGHIRVVSCMTHLVWVAPVNNGRTDMFAKEAKKEGFITWGGLLLWFHIHKIKIEDTFRIEFEVVE